MTTATPLPPVTALIYIDGFPIDSLMRRIVDHLVEAGVPVGGFVQINEPRTGRTRCDMVLEEVATGQRVMISENRGALARGCLLDTQELARAETLAERALDDAPAMLVLNKFGKSEAQGRGFRPLIAAAIERGVPLLIAVPARNLDPWRHFTAELSCDWPAEDLVGDTAAICERLGFAGLIAAPELDAASASQIRLP